MGKNTITAFLIVLVTGLLIISCRKKDDPQPISWKVKEGYMGFTNGDSLWSAKARFKKKYYSATDIPYFNLEAHIYNSPNSAQYFNISWEDSVQKSNLGASLATNLPIDAYITLDTETFDLRLASDYGSRGSCPESSFYMNIIEIDSIKRTISGTFGGLMCSFRDTIKNPIEMKNGQFYKVPF